MSEHKTQITVEAEGEIHSYHFNGVVDNIRVGDKLIINDEVCTVTAIEIAD